MLLVVRECRDLAASFSQLRVSETFATITVALKALNEPPRLIYGIF